MVFKKCSVVVVALFAAFGVSCSGSDDAGLPGAETTSDPNSSRAAGNRGESCMARSDCLPGLACIDWTCVENDFPIAQSTKGCDYIQCRAADDCVDYVDECVVLRDACAAADLLSCTELADRCVFGCVDLRCVSTCSTDTDCTLGVCGPDAVCVACNVDTDCDTDDICVGNACITPCSTDFDCPLFHTCTAGDCVDDGCSSDRECAAATGNPKAICLSGGCVVECVSDAECNFGWNYDFMGCLSGTCQYLGCESADECRARYYGAGAITGDVLEIECNEAPTAPAPPASFEPPGFCAADERACDGGCVPAWQVCDGFSDCSSGADEINCPPCGSSEWECPSNGQCIPSYWVCDYFIDCTNGDDEAPGIGCP